MPAGSHDRLWSVLVLLVVLLMTGFIGIVRAEENRPTDLFVSAGKVMQTLISQRPLTLVDIRSKDDFGHCRIPGSINIPLAFIKNRSFLKNRSLVLLSRGYGQRFMEAECRRLRQRGFKAAILLGGLCAWKQERGKLEGDLTAVNPVALITPRRFFQEKDASYWLMVNTSLEPVEDLPEPFASAIRIGPALAPEIDLQKLRQAVWDHGNDSLLTVLAASTVGKTDVRMEKVVTKALGVPVVFLQGGLQNYRRFLAQRNMAAQARRRGLKTIGDCFSCRRTQRPVAPTERLK